MCAMGNFLLCVPVGAHVRTRPLRTYNSNLPISPDLAHLTPIFISPHHMISGVGDDTETKGRIEEHIQNGLPGRRDRGIDHE